MKDTYIKRTIPSIFLLLLSLLLFLPGCSSAVQAGDTVALEYIGKLSDGMIIDSSAGKEPLTFIAGSGQVIPGFDDAVIGMKIDEEKKFTITPREGYGERDPQLVQNIPLEQLPTDREPKVGMDITLTSPEGRRVMAKIVRVTENEVLIDANHPLAGETLNFQVKLLSIN